MVWANDIWGRTPDPSASLSESTFLSCPLGDDQVSAGFCYRPLVPELEDDKRRVLLHLSIMVVLSTACLSFVQRLLSHATAFTVGEQHWFQLDYGAGLRLVTCI